MVHENIYLFLLGYLGYLAHFILGYIFEPNSKYVQFLKLGLFSPKLWILKSRDIPREGLDPQFADAISPLWGLCSKQWVYFE